MKTLIPALAILACFTAPAFADTAEEYPCGNVRWVVSTVQDPDDQHVVVKILDRAGKPLAANISAPGDFVPLCGDKKFLLLDTSLERAPGESWLMSATGEKIARFDLGYVAGFGAEAEDKVFWVQGFEAREWGAATRLRVFDAQGKSLLDKVYEHGAAEQLVYGGATYEIGVLEPEKPSYLTRPAVTP